MSKKRLSTQGDFNNCWVFQHAISVEHKEEDVIIDSGTIEKVEFPFIILNGKTYNINDFLFFY